MLRRATLAVALTLALAASGCVPLPPVTPQLDREAMTAVQTTARDRTAVHAALGPPDTRWRDGRLEGFHRTGDAGTMVWFPMLPFFVPIPAVDRLGAVDHFLFVAYDDADLVAGTLLWSKVEKERRPPQVQATGSLAALGHEPPTARLVPVVFWGETEPPAAMFDRRQDAFRSAQRQRPWAAPLLSPNGRLVALRTEEPAEGAPARRGIVLRDTGTGAVLGRLLDHGVICGTLQDRAPRGYGQGRYHAQRREILADGATLLALTTEPALCRLTLPSGALRKLALPPVADADDLRLVRLDEAHLALATPDGGFIVLDSATGERRQVAAPVPGMLDCTAPVPLTADGHLLQSCVTEPSGELDAIAARRPGPRLFGSHYAAATSAEARRVLVLREPASFAPRELWRGPAPGKLPFHRPGFDLRHAGAIAVDRAHGRVALLHGPLVELFALALATDGTLHLDPLPLLPLSSAHGALITDDPLLAATTSSTSLPGAHSLEVRDADRGWLQSVVPMPQVLQFSADGSRLAAGFVGCVVWDTGTWREVWRCDLEEGWRVPELRRGFALTPDGRHIVTDDGLYRLP